LMQAQSSQPIQTFTIGYEQAEGNAAGHARRIAQHLGTTHTEFIIRPVDILDSITQLPNLFDEPFSHKTQLSTLLMAQLASTTANVVLSGQGAQQLLGGSPRYGYAQQLWRRLQHLPGFVRQALARTLHRFEAQRWHNISELLDACSPEDIYRHLVSHWQNPEEVVLGIHATHDPLPPNLPTRLTVAERMMYWDTVGYLPDALLTSTDRASMSVSLETRSPFLDPRIVEWAWQLPLRLKIRNGQGAWLLRQMLERHLPPALNNASPQQEPMPLGDWLRNGLRDWAEALLDVSRLQQEGFFDPTPIREKWQQHLTGKQNWQHYLWDVLMFQAWHEQQTPVICAMAA